MWKFCKVKSLIFKTQNSKNVYKELMGARILHSIQVQFFALEIKILFLKVTVALSLFFNADKSWTRMNVEFSIPMQTPCRHFSIFGS